MRVHQQPAFVLLNRPYSESSWIVEVFSLNYGRLALIAKGARRIKSSLKGVLLPFQPLLISWSGKGEVPTLTAVEIDQQDYHFVDNELLGDALVCGFYCNELLINLMHRYDPHVALYKHYHRAVLSLSQCHKADAMARVLREFEKNLIKETGYAVNFKQQADGKSAIQADKYYLFQQGQGFIVCRQNHNQAISGRVILAMDDEPAEQMLNSQEVSQSKHLMRLILGQTLGYKKVISRELFFPK